MSEAWLEAERFTSFVDALNARAAERPAQLAYAFLADGEHEAERLTFAELDRKARAIGSYLQELNAQGERALILCPPGLDYIAAFYGCLYGGTLAVPVYPLKMNRNLGRLLAIIDDARTSVALTTSRELHRVQKHFAQVPALRTLRWLDVNEIDPARGDEWRADGLSRETTAFLQYTSGSTSASKGVMVSHGNLLYNEAMMRAAFGHDDATVMVSWLPLYHDMGLIGIILAAAYNGVPCYFMSPADFLKRPVRWLNAMSRYKGTFSGAPNFAYELCVQKIDQAQCAGLDLSSWKVAGNGSEPVRASTLNRFAQTFARCGFRPEVLYPCYGLAEATLFVSGGRSNSPPVSATFNREKLEQHHVVAGSDACDTLVSCGQPWLGERIVIVSPETLKPCAPGEIGEILVSGEMVAQGYWAKPAATEEVFRVYLPETNNGPFLRTGDLGFFHQDELYVTGRRKDMLILRGRNLYPQDLELTAEESHHAIARSCSAAFAVEYEGAEHLVIAAEVAREYRHDLDVQEVAARVRLAIAAQHDIELFALALLAPGALPKTSSGKIQRGACRQAFLSNTLSVLDTWQRSISAEGFAIRPLPADVEQTPESIASWLTHMVADLLRIKAAEIDTEQPFATCGLDSLNAVELGLRIEETLNVQVSADSLFAGDPSIASIASLLYRQLREQPAQSPNGNGRIGACAENAARSLDECSETVPPTYQIAPDDELPAVSVTESSRVPHDTHDDRAAEAAGQHFFPAYLNPHLGRLLSQLKMDQSFVRGEGCYLYDQAGRKYLDFLAQYGALPFGFNPPRIWRAIEQVHASLEPSLVQPSFLNAAGELAQKLSAIAPAGLRYVTFANSGAEAVEAAIKLCKSSTGRPKVLAANNGFHGKTLAALSATDRKKYQHNFGAPVPGYDYVRFGDLPALKRALGGKQYAAYIVEPIQGEGGIIEAPRGYLAQAQALCRDTGTLLIVDEIQTGLGRTGAMFACDAEELRPDVLLVGKALGGGLMPIGACLCTAEVYNEDFALKHTSTFAGNTLACRVGLATIQWLEADERALIHQVTDNGARMKLALNDLKRKYRHVIREVRGRGYMLGLCFGVNRSTWGSGLLRYLGETEVLAALVASHMLNREGVRLGCTLNDGGVLRIEPPLVATWLECENFLAALERTLARLATRNLAYFTSHLTGFSANGDAPTRPARAAARRLSPRDDDGRFAFILHPLTEHNYVDVDPSMSALSAHQIETLAKCMADNFDPFVVGEARVVSATGQRAYGEFIIVPRSAAELVQMPHAKARSEIKSAVRLAQDHGAKIIGLGAFTSIVSRGGLALVDNQQPALTSGNSLTAAIAMRSIETALAASGQTMADTCVAVVGASGAIGGAVAQLLARHVRRLILLGNPAHPEASRSRLLEVVATIIGQLHELRQKGINFPAGTLACRLSALARIDLKPRTRDAYLALAAEIEPYSDSIVASCDQGRWLPEADVVVTATSALHEIIRPDELRSGAVVCDISRPPSVGRELRASRPDVTVFDGGIVHLPASSRIDLSTDLPAGMVYACMAETMILALERQYQNTGLGINLDIVRAAELERQAERHGFKTALDRAIFERTITGFSTV